MRRTGRLKATHLVFLLSLFLTAAFSENHTKSDAHNEQTAPKEKEPPNATKDPKELSAKEKTTSPPKEDEKTTEVQIKDTTTNPTTSTSTTTTTTTTTSTTTTVKPTQSAPPKKPKPTTLAPPVHKDAERTAETANKTSPQEAPSSEGNKTQCIIPAIAQFPTPLMSANTRKHGGLIIHLFVAVYMFIGLAIVCDDYFVASLDRICEELQMSPDVAGATFMAAGSSAPELATVVIGVFFAHDDIGVSGVIGSAVFNIAFVVSVCALCSGTAIYLNWWPMVRDSFFYTLAILAMLFTMASGTISWGESLFMLFMYVIYCIVLHYNTPLERWAQMLPLPFKKPAPAENISLMNYKSLEEEGKHANYGLSPENMDFGLDGAALNRNPEPAPAAAPRPDYYKPKDPTAASLCNPLIKPEDCGLYRKVRWAVCYPIHYLCRKTIPDCRTERFKNWYAFTFFVAMIWISFYSYFMVWMITIIGYTLGVPDTVMGLTFVAAGVSVPDALSSVAVIKEGYGDMAVSNAVGSNVFDILICLGLPWFIKTAIQHPGTEVPVISKGLTYSTVSLLSTVVFLVVSTHLNGWKLDRKLGVILMIWYLIFITVASMYEMNVFGELNPPECVYDF